MKPLTSIFKYKPKFTYTSQNPEDPALSIAGQELTNHRLRVPGLPPDSFKSIMRSKLGHTSTVFSISRSHCVRICANTQRSPWGGLVACELKSRQQRPTVQVNESVTAMNSHIKTGVRVPWRGSLIKHKEMTNFMNIGLSSTCLFNNLCPTPGKNSTGRTLKWHVTELSRKSTCDLLTSRAGGAHFPKDSHFHLQHWLTSRD